MVYFRALHFARTYGTSMPRQRPHHFGRICREYGAEHRLTKPARVYVYVVEFCHYTHLPEEEVSRAMNGTPASANHRST